MFSLIKSISLYILFINQFLTTIQLLCGKNNIEHCIKCNSQHDICDICEDKYFPLFGGGAFCISCSNETYGQVGCQGNCNGTTYALTKIPLCEENGCKEGYYNIKGICNPCSVGSANCAKCIYLPSENRGKEFRCIECVGGLYGDYRVQNDGLCGTCNLPNCIDSQYVNGTNDCICKKCVNEYYINSHQSCSHCEFKTHYISGGIFYEYYCPDDGIDYSSRNYYTCYTGYTLINQNTCISCETNCYSCSYDPPTTKCNICKSGYVITPSKTCIPYPYYCHYAYYDTVSGTAKCSQCNSGYVLTNSKSCIPYPSYCSSAYYDTSSGTAKCSQCYSGYVLTNTKLCINCPTNCYSCYFDTSSNSGKCQICKDGYGLNLNGECISCGGNCKNCHLDSNSNKICIDCYYHYLVVQNICEYMNIPAHCKNHLNERFNNINEYKCQKCDSYYSLNETNNICMHCPDNCPNCHFEENNTFYCDSCDNNYVLNENSLCENCTSNEKIGGIGCLNCKFEGGKNKCIKCSDDYIFIENDIVCKFPPQINLNATCETAIRLENNNYSCTKCRKGNYTFITRYNNISDCYLAQNELINCVEGYEDIEGKAFCNICIYDYRLTLSRKYQQYICDDICDYDCFFNNNYTSKGDYIGCVKCDNMTAGGQIGCNSTQGCSYNKNDSHFYCESCKDGYFKFDWQCLPCSRRDGNCTQCHFDESEERFKCDKCVDKFYVNKTSFLCDIITYDEYPEVTAGCILPINNHTLYEERKKCYDCKYGFFKTKDETCIYCKARKNGGPKCDECKYIIDENEDETNKINCNICSIDNMLSPSGRCYNCTDEVGPGCSQCKFDDETEDVICEICEEHYTLNSEGYCSFKYSEDVSNCLIYERETIRRRLREISHLKCKICHDGYYLTNNACESLSYELCSLKSIFEKSIYNECKKFCEMMYYPFVVYKNNNEEIENILANNSHISYDSLKKEIRNIIENGTLCMKNITENIELRKCREIEYDYNTKKYKCSKCIDGYHLNNSNSKCAQIDEIVEKNKTKKECNNETILIKAEKDTFCEEPKGELEGCTNGATAVTQYVNTIYNCHNCVFGYEPFFSAYYDRWVCLGTDPIPLENKKILSEDAYKGIDKDGSIENGTCKIKDTFTPDGINCYLCNNENVGMPGCKGSCSYSIERINILECEDKCLSGYIETSKGVCGACEEINEGCLNCTYNKDYPIGYSGLRRNNRFECLECDDGYQLTKDGLCHHCSEFGFTYCDQCTKNNTEKELECIKCIDGYFLNSNGYCTKCEEPKVQGTNLRCIFCNNTGEGGIEGCEVCSSDNGNITCLQCKNGYILLENNQSCIHIGEEENEEKTELEVIRSYTNCEKILLNDNNEYKCTKCFDNYNFLYDKNRDEERCVNNEFLITPKSDTFLKFCKQVINMGTEDQPKHSCNKCVENNILSQKKREAGITITKITFPENGTSFCDISSNYNGLIDNCSEATWLHNQDGDGFFNCTKCIDDTLFLYKADLDMRICAYFNYSRYCMVKNCKTCKKGNNYFCSQCLLENYEVNPATGSCVKILPKPPVISWKDMYRLTINSKTQLNSQALYGYSVNLRGISYNQINTGHAFLIDLIFDVLYKRNLRNIEENETETETLKETKELKIPAYCQIISHTDEVKNKVNLIDYYCLGNRTGKDETKENEITLKNVEMSKDDNEENTEFIQNSNFEDMISELNLAEIKDKDVSSFTLKMFDDITVFEMDEVANQISEDYKFDFTISGQINRELEPDTIKANFKLIGIVNKTADCEFNIKENQTADIKCYVDLKNYKDKEPFRFKTIEFKYKESSIFLNRFNEIKLVHQEKKPNIWKIILIVAACILFLIIIIIAIILIRIFLKKRKIIKTNIPNLNNLDYNNPKNKIDEKPIKKRSIKNVHEKSITKLKRRNIKNITHITENPPTTEEYLRTIKKEIVPEEKHKTKSSHRSIKNVKQEKEENIYNIKNQ